MARSTVLLPGNMCDERLWRGEHGAIVESLPRPAVDADLTRDDRIDAMARRALDATQGPLLPVGFSMGAIVALEMARQAPERIAGLVLIGVNASADLPERAERRPAQQAEVRAGGLERVLVEELKPNYLAARNRQDEPLLALLRDMGMSLGSEVFVRQSEALRTRTDLRPMLPALTIPVLLLCGEEDALCPPAWHRGWAEAIGDATLHVVSGAGHMLPLEAPGTAARHITQWLEDRF